MHHYLDLISNDGDWSSILTISGKEPSAFTKERQLPQTCLCVFCTIGKQRQQPLQRQLSNCFGSSCLTDAIVPLTQIKHHPALLSRQADIFWDTLCHRGLYCASWPQIWPGHLVGKAQALEQVHLTLNAGATLCRSLRLSVYSFLSVQ